MKHTFFALILYCLLACQQHQLCAQFTSDEALDYCASQIDRAMTTLKNSTGGYDYSMEPRNILTGDSVWNCRKASEQEWCSGFWPGILWMDYSYLERRGASDEEKLFIRRQAEGYTEALSFLGSQSVYDHDLGFLVINSFLKGYEATGNEEYKRIALAAADSLATLYNNKVGTILSWPRHVKDYGGHNTIMDNMINLELLFWADSVRRSENGNRNYALGSSVKSVNSRLYDIAVSHADTTMRYHFRPDGSCYHVAVYDTLTGHFIKGMTHQGYADSSMWSRGQSWAIYGYTMVYRYTHEQRFLRHAQKVTDIYLKRLKQTSDDMIPLWDMDDPRGLKAPKDASAACVVASALLELSQYVDKGKAQTYRTAAMDMLRDLNSSNYQSREKNVAFLMHSTGHHPAGSEIDASIIYADYYYLEALLRSKNL